MRSPVQSRAPLLVQNTTFLLREVSRFLYLTMLEGTIINDPKLDDPILHLVGETADSLELDCYVIGGWVRDLLLHRESKDIDVVCIRRPQSKQDYPDKVGIVLADAVAKRLGRGAHLSVFRTYGTAQVKKHDLELEFVGARRESYQHDSRNPIVEDGTLEEDQDRRDFTINALAICLNADRYGTLLDPHGGVHDMMECTIRTPLDPDITFSDDPLRMMRAVRFASQLGFYLDGETYDAIARNAKRLEIITRERIVDELNKIMLSRRPSVGLKLLDSLGLMPLICPEITALKGIETVAGRGHKDVFLHTLQVVDNVAEATKNDEDKDRVLWLRWAALMHDIGKPRTKEWIAGIGWTFRNHDYVGQRMIPKIFGRMKLPQNEKMEYVRKLVGLHMRPINLIEDTVTDSAVRRLLFDAGEDIDDLMILCDADITSRNEEKVRRYHHNYEILRQKMVELEERDRIRCFQPPIHGEEIMSLLNLPPCAVVGELKTAIKDAILDGIIPNEYAPAREYLIHLAKERGLKPCNE